MLSLEWLAALVDLDGLDPEDVAKRLTSSTAEVEHILASDLALGGTFAEVVAQEGSLRLHDGAETLTAAVPGGLRAGDRVVVDAAGAIIPQPLGGADAWRVEPGLAAGTRVADVLGTRPDTLFELDNKSLTHRPDLWGHYGFARELSAIFDRELAELDLADVAGAAAAPLPVEVDSDDCGYYSALTLGCSADAATPLRLQRRLAALGQRSRGLIVDVSNYVMFELAQPTHPFDARGVQSLRVAPAGKRMRFTGVDGVPRALEPEDLIIWSGDRAAGLAGIIGALDGSVAGDTSAVVLESANFSAKRVRRTQVRLGLRTEAGQRFEKSQPWRMAPVAAARFVRLMQDFDPQAALERSLAEVGGEDRAACTITVSTGYFSDVTGIEIPHERSAAILRSLRFDVQESEGHVTVTVPPFRSDRDISGPHDLLEEVARIVGYDNIRPELPPALARPVPLADPLERVRHVLTYGHRFNEVQSYGWFDGQFLNQIGHIPRGALELSNPTAPHLAQMRTTLVPNLLAFARLNRERPGEGRIFELGHVYEQDPGQNVLERITIAGVVWNRVRAATEEDLLRGVRGVVEDMLAALRREPETVWEPAADHEVWGAPGTVLTIRAGGETLGTVGSVPEKVAAAIGRGLRVATFELDLDAVGRVSPAKFQFELPTVFPGSWFDLSFEWPELRGYRQLAAAVAVDHPLLVGRDFLSVFRNSAGTASYTFRFWVESTERTLSSEDLEDVRAQLVSAATQAGASLRSR